MHPEIMHILSNTHPETNYALFPVHHVRALVAIVQMLTGEQTYTREPLLDIRFYPLDVSVPIHDYDPAVRNSAYQVTINNRYLGVLRDTDWRALTAVLDPLTIPYEITLVDESGSLGMNYVRR